MLELLLPAALPALSLSVTSLVKYLFDKVGARIPSPLVPVIAAISGGLLNYIPTISVGNVVAGALLGLAATGVHQVYVLTSGKEK